MNFLCNGGFSSAKIRIWCEPNTKPRCLLSAASASCKSALPFIYRQQCNCQAVIQSFKGFIPMSFSLMQSMRSLCVVSTAIIPPSSLLCESSYAYSTTLPSYACLLCLSNMLMQSFYQAICVNQALFINLAFQAYAFLFGCTICASTNNLQPYIKLICYSDSIEASQFIGLLLCYLHRMPWTRNWS